MLPIFQTPSKDISQLQTTWSAQLNPLLALPLSNSVLIQGVVLAPGLNVVNHKLGRKLRGWLVVGIDNGTTIYDGQGSNQMQDLTLYLISGAACTVSLIVF